MSEESTAEEMLLEFLNAVEAGIAAAKQRYKEIKGIAEKKGTREPAVVLETTFNILKFEQQQGAKIGEYEVAYKANNLEDKWNHAYNILRQNNATIADRYYGEGYVYGYWLYGEGKIYRQKLKAPNKSS